MLEHEHERRHRQQWEQGKQVQVDAAAVGVLAGICVFFTLGIVPSTNPVLVVALLTPVLLVCANNARLSWAEYRRISTALREDGCTCTNWTPRTDRQR
ncbi:hypothetical protein [Nocardia sp. CY41]|uniref:hypothetical protein n=1 Tax=Nocardia sp. CY41 TaxID=2608686 RepID=UPI00135B3BFF|nr:hypothetical protein [Nocardia sp. CY41]